jgi:hypothetical protein
MVLTVTDVQTGAVTCGLWFTAAVGHGFWNEAAQSLSLSFTVTFDQGSANLVPDTTVAVFEGFLFRTPAEPQLGQDVTATLTGSFLVSAVPIPGTSTGFWPEASVRRQRFGWFAQTIEIL